MPDYFYEPPPYGPEASDDERYARYWERRAGPRLQARGRGPYQPGWRPGWYGAEWRPEEGRWWPGEFRELEAGETRGRPEAVEGAYRGRGPRGYRRADERIRDEVCDFMEDHPQLDARDIDVSVENAEVMLEGGVTSRAAKRLAEEIAESVRGVVDVHNRLRISRPTPEQAPAPRAEERPVRRAVGRRRAA